MGRNGRNQDTHVTLIAIVKNVVTGNVVKLILRRLK